MSRTTKLATRLTAAVAVIGTITAISASTAIAAPSSYSPAGPSTGTGTLTWSVDGAPSITCPSITVTGTGGFTNSTFGPQGCNGKSTWVRGMLLPETDGAASRWVKFMSPIFYVYTPFGRAVDAANLTKTAPWINGNALTPSRIQFNNMVVGQLDNTNPPALAGKYVRITGTVTVTTAGGGLITIN